MRATLVALAFAWWVAPLQSLTAQQSARLGADTAVAEPGDQSSNAWHTRTELDPSRNVATHTVFKYGRRLVTQRPVTLAVTCYPGHQLEVSLISPEYLHDYREVTVRTDVRVQADHREPVSLEAGLQGHYIVYFDAEASRQFLSEVDAASDSLFVGISRGAFPSYDMGFAVRRDDERRPKADFCSG